MSSSRSSERQINERINSLKTLMSNLALSNNVGEISGPQNGNISPSKHSSPSETRMLSTPTRLLMDSFPTRQNSVGIISMGEHPVTPILDGVIFGGDEEEVKMLRENNHALSTKIMNLEDTVNNYAVEVRFIKEELHEAESRIKSLRQELDQEVERRRNMEKENQEEIRALQQQLEEAQAQIEIHEQKERGISESRQTLESINRELEKNNKEKAEQISELVRELSQKRIDCEDLERELQQLQKEKKSIEDVLLDERKTHERIASELQDEIYSLNAKHEDKLRKITKEIERDKAKQSELMGHFKRQLQQLEEQVEAYRKQMIDLQTQNQKLIHHANQLAQRERFIKGKLESAQEQIQQNSTQHALLHQNYMHLNKEKEQLQISEKRLKEQIEDMNRKQEQKNEKNNKENEKLNKEIRQLQQTTQRQLEKINQSDSRVAQLEQSRDQLQSELEREKEDRRQDVAKATRQVERLHQDLELQHEKFQHDIRIMQEQNDKLREMMSQKEQSYQEHLDIIRSELEETQAIDETLASGKTERYIAEMSAKLKLLEERNEILERKNRQHEIGNQSVNKSLHTQNEILRENLNAAQREKEELNDKIRIMTQHQREQDELLALSHHQNGTTENGIDSKTKHEAKQISNSPSKKLIDELTKAVDFSSEHSNLGPSTKRSAYLEREYNLSPRRRPLQGISSSPLIRSPLIGSSSASSSSLLLNNVNLTPTSRRKSKTQLTIQRPSFTKQ